MDCRNQEALILKLENKVHNTNIINLLPGPVQILPLLL